jgi:DNA polymerase-3 subunit gamma/tau
VPALYRKYRPQVFGDVIGQEPIIKTLRRAIKSGRVGHAYLFSGPRGVGKTTVARILAKAVNCLGKGDVPCGKCKNCLDIAEGRFIDLIEVDAASNRGIDEIRDLRDKIKFAPSIGAKKVYIIDEVHMLTKEAFNALLKTLEEPPDHSIFVFATTELHKVPETVISRCQRFDFRLGQEASVAQSIGKIAKSEKLKLTNEALALVVRSSGSYRDAVSALDQLSSHITEKPIEVHEMLKILNLTALDQVVTLVEYLKQSDLLKAMAHLSRLEEKGVDYGQFVTAIIKYLRAELIEAVEKSADPSWHKMALQRIIQAESDLKLSPIESLAIELAAIDICEAVKSLPAGEAGVKGKGESDSIQNTIDNPVKPEKHQEIEVQEAKSKTKEIDIAVKPSAQEDKIESISSEQRMAIIEQVTIKNKPLGFLLSSASWQADKGSVVLVVGYPLHRDKILSTRSRQIIDEEIKSVMGKSLPIRCVVEKSAKEDTVGENIGQEIEEVFG